MPDPVNTRPSGRDVGAIGHRFGTRRLRELLAVRGDAGLWLAEDDDGRESLLRLYPGLPTVREWHELELAASWLKYAADPRLVQITEVALDVWPRVSFACADAEALAERIAREPMAPAAAVAMCADVAGALAALERVGVGPVDIGPADIVLVGERARLLADVGLPRGQLGHACVDLEHAAPERAAAIAARARGVAAERPDAAFPTAESMTYALASIVSAAIRGQAAPPARLEQALRRGLAERPSERYGTPAALVAALADAVGVPVARSDARAPRWTRRRDAGAVVPRRGTRPGRRGAGIAIPAAAALVAAVIGVAAGSATTPPGRPVAVTLSGPGLTVEAPPGWVRAAPGEAPPAIGQPALVVRSAGSHGATELVVARAAAPLLARVADAAPEPVRLGAGRDAWRYRDVAIAAGAVADVYLLEDRDGPVAAACVGPPGAPASVRAACAAAVTTLRLAGPVVPLGGAAAARGQLARVVGDLDRARERERRALATAPTGRRQAAAADRLGAAFARAAAGAARVGTVGAPGDLARLVARLEETGRAYAALAAAARGTHRAAYAHARARVVVDERALQQAVAALGSASPGA
ncbi:MAG TPA: hypothetical protein VFU94_06935 [Conexibacter sp.]|nr:hypothetical protein [Conexibacter sp.]